MKILLTLLLALFVSQAYAFPVDENGKRIITMAERERCGAKGDLTMFVYRHRDMMSQDDMMLIFQNDWDVDWSKKKSITHTSYVDMQRIIRDAYRTDRSGEYIRGCCTKEIEESRTVNELTACLNQGY